MKNVCPAGPAPAARSPPHLWCAAVMAYAAVAQTDDGVQCHRCHKGCKSWHFIQLNAGRSCMLTDTVIARPIR
eukprot:7385036-Prymnesium_polylepis.1